MTPLLQLDPMDSWITTRGPLIVSGPCSVESECQIVDTARLLAASGRVHVLRAGIWKPRTRPGNYEGMGSKALKWLIRAKEVTGLPVATEVATPDHVAKCLDVGVDMLWVGARTTANPFYVQQIADSLRGIDIPVFVKNPINPDIELWIGALERLNLVGIKKLLAVHRGFSTFDGGFFRNAPMWDIPIELKTRLPGLHIICDPSHITGNREMIFSVAQKAMDLSMDGLMIESHIDPGSALSDAKQQIPPDRLAAILEKLVMREAIPISKACRHTLELLREQIDVIDDRIIHAIAERMKIAEQIGLHKYRNGITIFQLDRWEKIISTRSGMGATLGLDGDFIKKLLRVIHQESIQIQQEVMDKSIGKT